MIFKPVSLNCCFYSLLHRTSALVFSPEARPPDSGALYSSWVRALVRPSKFKFQSKIRFQIVQKHEMKFSKNNKKKLIRF